MLWTLESRGLCLAIQLFAPSYLLDSTRKRLALGFGEKRHSGPVGWQSACRDPAGFRSTLVVSSTARPMFVVLGIAR